METVQKPTSENNQPNTENKPVKLTPMHAYGDSYIDYCAVQGLITDESGEIKRMTAQEFAQQIGVSRQSLYDWQKAIPDFWVKVQERRKELGGRNRIAKIYNGLYLKAAAGDAKAAALYLANNDPNFRMPSQKIEHEAGNSIVELLNKAREAQRQINEKNTTQEPIEGEVVNEPNDHNS